MNTVVRAQDIAYSYASKTVLDAINFSLAEGSFCALLGPNGAGKTTLFSLLSQFISPQRGHLEFYFDGKCVNGRKALQSMGFVFQQTTLDLDLTVAQNLHYHASLHGIDRTLAQRRIEVELGRMDMQDRAQEKVRSLNGGHKRRVEIARALLHRPSFLLLDEPTVGLDMQTRENISDYIHSLCASDGTTILYTTHLLDEIHDSDHVIFLHEGTITQQGLCKDLLDSNDASDLRTLWANSSDLNQ